MNPEGQKVLDLTDPQIANEWGFLKGESSLLECASNKNDPNWIAPWDIED